MPRRIKAPRRVPMREIRPPAKRQPPEGGVLNHGLLAGGLLQVFCTGQQHRGIFRKSFL
jgi:hypothetical protein